MHVTMQQDQVGGKGDALFLVREMHYPYIIRLKLYMNEFTQIYRIFITRVREI